MDKGMTCSFRYDGNNLLTGHEDFLGNDYTIGYEGSSPFKVTSWTDPAICQTTFTYAQASSPYDKKTTVTDAEAIAIEYYFGASSQQLEKIQQYNGLDTLKIEMGYDGTTGYQTSSIDAYGNITTLSYDSVGHMTQITPAGGAAGQYTVAFTYSPPVSINSVLEETEETVTDQVDATTSYLYTDMDNPCLPTSIIDPIGQITSQTYNAHGQVTSITKPTTGGAKTTSYTYSPAGYISTVAQREGGTTAVSDKTITRNQFNAVTGTADSVTGLTSSYTTDANGADLCSTSEGGCNTCSAYTDAQGNTQANPPVFYIQPWNPPFQGNVSAYSVPYRPNPYSTTNSRGETTIYTYYDNGNVYTATNHIGQTSTLGYDDFGRLETSTDHAAKNIKEK
jgi:YD repeat-containing protein